MGSLEGGAVFHPLTRLRIPSRPLNVIPILPTPSITPPPILNMSFNNNFAGDNFGYSTPENNPCFDGYPSEMTDRESSSSSARASGLKLDPTLAGLSTAEIEEWWLTPELDDTTGQYTGSTLLDYSCDKFAGAYWSQTDNSTGKSHCILLSIVNTILNTENSHRPRSRF